MAKNLVIVESPSKAKTIQKFLGSNYTVIACGGHVRDLPKSTLGIDVEDKTYEPKYITIRGKGEQLAALRKEAKKASKIYLATDPDREGEAISWHLKFVLNLDENKKCYRITFNEITKNAVKAAFSNARDIDLNIVDAQQTRRIVDRLVGYMISPLLWQKVKRGLSAGRVQSVVLRLIADRENEINAFIPKASYTIDTNFKISGSKKPLASKFYGINGKKKELNTKEEADKILKLVENKDYKVTEVKFSDRLKKCPLPFTTSSLQQEASKSLNYSTVKTMRVAQQLYEGVSVKNHGTIGLITYLRTDSTRISDEAHKACQDYIADKFGENYVGKNIATEKSKKKIQDAHEAIRPTYVELSPEVIKGDLTNEQYRLYNLIWKRFVASRMSEAVFQTASININCNTCDFKSSLQKLVFDGYTKVYSEVDDKEETNKTLIAPEVNEVVNLLDINVVEHFTQPPAHYTEASMVKTMEELGIGRPSTYAPTISTLLSRHYISKEGRNLFISETGEAVNNIMVNSFGSIVEVDFTANIETLLDGVEEGDVNWKSIVANFYPDLEKAVDKAKENIGKVEIHDEVSDVECDLCGRMMVIKYGPHGKFLGCPGFPECKNTKPFLEKTGIPCPDCGSELIIRRTRKGRKYYGCEKYPDCNYMSWQKPVINK